MSTVKEGAAGPAHAQRTKPFTSQEYLESLRDGREIWIYGERVKDVTTHPAFRNTVRMLARLYDALHDPSARTSLHADRYRQRRLHAQVLQGADERRRTWSARATRSPSGRASRTAGWAARPITRPRFWPRSARTPTSTSRSRTTRCAGTRRSTRRSRSSITRSSIRRSTATSSSTKSRDVYMHVEKETDGGLIVSGAKVVATTSTLTHYNFIANNGALPIKTEGFRVRLHRADRLARA